MKPLNVLKKIVQLFLTQRKIENHLKCVILTHGPLLCPEIYIACTVLILNHCNGIEWKSLNFHHLPWWLKGYASNSCVFGTKFSMAHFYTIRSVGLYIILLAPSTWLQRSLNFFLAVAVLPPLKWLLNLAPFIILF